MIEITNKGEMLTSTNYWDTDAAERGLIYLTWNAGTARLLLPAACEMMLPEIKTGHSAIIEESLLQPGTAVIVFDDGSDAPYSISLAPAQTDRAIRPGQSQLIVYTEAGKQLSMPLKIATSLNSA